MSLINDIKNISNHIDEANAIVSQINKTFSDRDSLIDEVLEIIELHRYYDDYLDLVADIEKLRTKD